jgi:general secretion pathway protein C
VSAAVALPASLRDLQNLSPQQWVDRAQRSLPQIVSVVLVIAIAWQLVQLTWLLLDRSSPTQPVAVVPPSSVNAPRRGVDVQAIVNAHLFGVPQAEQQTVTEAQPTQMNLVLSAVFATNDPAKGLAIIGESAQGGKVYTVGATVRPGTQLHAVYFDRVILDRGGTLEALALPKQNTAGLNINRPQPAAAPNTQFADSLRRIAENNPSAFAEVVRPQPVFANGVQRGYRVYPGRNRQQFGKLGLMPGDLVLSINGTPLDDPQRGMEVFNTISTSDRVSVTVERNGQSQELTLNTAQISLPDASQPAAPPRPQGRTQPPAFTPAPEVD